MTSFLTAHQHKINHSALRCAFAKFKLHFSRLKCRDVVLGLGPWSWVVLKDKITVLGPGLGLEGLVFGPVLGLETTVQSIALNYIHQCHWLSCSL